jgi:hypothetical protein
MKRSSPADSIRKRRALVIRRYIFVVDVVLTVSPGAENIKLVVEDANLGSAGHAKSDR